MGVHYSIIHPLNPYPYPHICRWGLPSVMLVNVTLGGRGEYLGFDISLSQSVSNLVGGCVAVAEDEEHSGHVDAPVPVDKVTRTIGYHRRRLLALPGPRHASPEDAGALYVLVERRVTTSVVNTRKNTAANLAPTMTTTAATYPRTVTTSITTASITITNITTIISITFSTTSSSIATTKTTTADTRSVMLPANNIIIPNTSSSTVQETVSIIP